MNNAPLLDTAGAARLLGVSQRTLQNWIQTGRVDVPYTRLTRRTIRFDAQVLSTWIVGRQAETMAALAARRASRTEGGE